MSEQTWKDEFMPEPASNAVMSELQAIEHSLRKWRGFTNENIAKHGLANNHELLQCTSSTCALCLRHSGGCEECSLALSRDGVPCDDRTPDESRSPYHAYAGRHFSGGNSPAPMIAALTCALEYEKANS